MKRADRAADDDAAGDHRIADARPAGPSVVAMAIAMPAMPNTVAGRERHGRGQPAQRQDEADGGDEIGEGCQIGFIACASAYFFFLNICSMRWVTMKPPKMLTEASATARNPMALGEVEQRRARRRSGRRR